MLNSQHQTRLLISKNEAITNLNDRIEQGRELFNKKIEKKEELVQAKTDRLKWYRYNLNLMLAIFSDASVKQSIEIPSVRQYNFNSFTEEVNDFRMTVKKSLEKLEYLLEDIDQYQESIETTYSLKNEGNKTFMVESHSYELN